MTRSALVSALALAATTFVAMPAQAAPASIAGEWKADDGRSVLQFSECGAAMCGKISQILVAQPAGGARDANNPDQSKRDRKLAGLRIFWDLSADGTKYKGKGYDPDEGRYFDAQVWRSGNQLKVKGCVLLFCRTASFTRT